MKSISPMARSRSGSPSRRGKGSKAGDDVKSPGRVSRTSSNGSKVSGESKVEGTGLMPPMLQGQIQRQHYTPSISQEVLMGNMQKIKSCVERFGCDVNTCGHDGLTPLHVAAMQGNETVCEYLVRKGGDMFARSNDGFTPLHMAARAGHLHIIKLFMASDGFYKGDIDIKTYNQWSSLHMACRDGRRKVFDYLVHETDRSAAIMDVDLDAKTGDGRTPMLICAELGDAYMVDELIKTGCNSCATCDRHGHKRMTALHLSSLVGSESVVKLLALMGEDIDAVTGGGWTPLMLAAHAGKGAVAKILVNAGADVTAKTKDAGHTALDLATRKGHDDIAELIRKEMELTSS